MYIVDFFKRTMRVSNIPIIIYLVLNVFVIIGITYLILAAGGIDNFGLAALIGLGIYIISLMITLSPIGEWVIRQQTGCKKIARREHREYLMPLFEEVKARARELDPTISPDVQLFINNDESMNAFATGRKTICVTKGLLDLPPEEIKAVLGHEFGHLAHKDTDLILVISVGNFFVTAIILIMRIIITIINGFFIILNVINRDWGSAIANIIIHFLQLVLISGISWLWTQLGVLLCMKSSRSNEFLADEFSFQLGYGDKLCSALDTVAGGHGAEGLFATLVSSHPDTDQRVGRLQDYEDLLINGEYPKRVFGFDNHGLERDDDVISSDPGLDPEIKPEIKQEIRPEIRPEIKPEVKQEIRSEVKPEIKPEIKQEIRPEVKPEIKPEVKSETPGISGKKSVTVELQCLSGEFAGMSFPIVEDEQIVIGRDPAQANIILKNPHISRRHCIIRYFALNNIFYVTDQSSYGTFLKDNEKLPKGRSMEIKPGTAIYLGDQQEAFLLVSAEM